MPVELPTCCDRRRSRAPLRRPAPPVRRCRLCAHPRRARRRGRPRRRRLVGRRGAGAQRRRGADADRPRPRRRVEHQPPGAGARHARSGRPRSQALRRAHRRHPSRLRGGRASRSSSSQDNWPALLPAPVDVGASMPATRAARRRRWPPGRCAAARRSSIVGAAGGKRAAAGGGGRGPRPRSRTTRCWRRCASACASATARARSGRDRPALRVLARDRARAATAQTVRSIDGSLNCHGYGSSVDGDGDLRHGRRGRRDRVARRLPAPAEYTRASYNRGLAGLLAQSVEQRTFNPLVAGSNPAQPTIERDRHAQFSGS